MAKVAQKDLAFDYFEPFDCGPRAPWLLELAKKHDVELKPEGDPFQIGVMMDCTETPGYTISLAGSQTGKSRPLLIEAIIMATGRIPISMQFPAGVDTGVPRLMDKDTVARFGIQPDGTCGTIKGVGVYPAEKIPDRGTGAEIWVGSFREVKEKMWRKRLDLLIPDGELDPKHGRGGWSERHQTYSFRKTGVRIRMNTYEQEYRKMEGDVAWMLILDEEPPVRDFFISAAEHCKYLRLCYTPINGLGWSYDDCYQPIVKGKAKNARIYFCTQYDSPFQTKEKVDAKFASYKPYEIKSRIFGQYTELTGKPYFDFHITKKFLDDYVPRYKLGRILPTSIPESPADAPDIKMRLDPAPEPASDVWEIYETYSPSYSYWLSADTATGAEDPNMAQDMSCAYVRRLPHAEEAEPHMVAALRSGTRSSEFAWLCLYAACYYNNCLIAAETGVSADGAAFVTTLKGYPHLYRHVSMNSKTRQLHTKIGFDMKGPTRKYIFDLIGTWCMEHQDNSKLYHYHLIKELSECIVGKMGRPDHSGRGSTDCLTAFGISEYVYQLARSQIRNNRNASEEDRHAERFVGHVLFPNIFNMNNNARETRPVLGSRNGMDRRFGFRYPRRQNVEHNVTAAY